MSDPTVSSPTPLDSEGTPPAGSRSRTLVRVVVILGILALSVWFVLQNIDWVRLGETIVAMHPGWMIAGVVITFGSHLARSYRWRLLIPSGEEISILDLFSATVIGYFMNNVIPRSGELVRPWVLARRTNRSMSGMVATIVVERLLDGASLLALLGGLLLFESERFEQIFVGYSTRTILLSILIPVALLAAVMAIVARTSFGERMFGWIEDRLPRRFSGRLRKIVADFRGGIVLGGPIKVLFWSLAIWGGYATAVYCGVLAFDLGTDYNMGFASALAILAVTTIGISIAPTPGAFGVYHFFSKIALVKLFGVSDERAVAFALVTHAAPYLAVMISGGIFLVRENISLRAVSMSSMKQQR